MSTAGHIILPHNITNISSGSNINVKIVIENQLQLLIKEIYLIFEGIVQVKWEDLISKNKNGEIIYFMQQFEGQEVNAKQHITVDSSGILPAGRHSYNLLVYIPQNIPETFVGKSGSIKYEFMLMIHDNWGKQKLYTLPINIQRSLTKLTKELMFCIYSFLSPLYTENIFCLPLCNSKPIITTLTISAASYMPGDIVKYYLLIENCANYFRVHRLSTVIIQTQKYKALKPKPRIKQDHCTLYIKTHCLARIPQNSKHCIEGSMQLSKSMSPTSVDPCLIMTSYKFQVLLLMNGLHTDGYITLPLVVRNHISNHSIGNYVSSELRLQMEGEPEYDILDCPKKNIIKPSELNGYIV